MMTDANIETKIKVIADKYGYNAQSRQCIEEMAELTQAINKLWRKQNYNGTSADIAQAHKDISEELADVLIMLLQMKELLGIDDTELSHKIEYKINRQLMRIYGGE